MNKDEKKIQIGPVNLDPSNYAYKGPFVGKETDEEIYIFREPLFDKYCPIYIVSHEGDTDFTIFFGNFVPHLEEFLSELMIILSYGELLNFKDSLEKGLKDFKTSKVKEEKESTKEIQPIEGKKLGMTLYGNTRFFSPNGFLILSSGKEIKIYFGRKMGVSNDKKITLFAYSVILPIDQAYNLVSIIDTNIDNFEKKHNVNIKDLIIKAKEMEDKQKGD